MREVYRYRQRKDSFLKEDPNSPLRTNGFTGLRYFPVSQKYVFRSAFERFEVPKERVLSGTMVEQVFWHMGTVRFRYNSREHSLEVFSFARVSEYLFIPFKDLTSGFETFEEGRYLEPQLRNDGRLLLDFNYAYNPYAAYAENLPSPLPPKENHLKVALRAGEKLYRTTRHPHDNII